MMWKAGFVFASVSIFGISHQEGPAIELNNHAYAIGVSQSNHDVYRSIPYAEKPVRWTRSEPILAYKEKERIDASCFKNQCFQTGKQTSPYQSIYLDLNDAGEKEDCLNLTIYKPQSSTENKESVLYPVLVYFHGGAFANGGNSQAATDMSQLANEYPEMVIVVPNYRLGPLGYFALPKEAADTDYGKRDVLVEGNQGITDVISALQWINTHIKHFKGNANDVTVMGISAGAYAIQYASVLMASSPYYLEKNLPQLFHKAILASGTMGIFPIRKRADAENEGLLLANEVGCYLKTIKETYECLMKKSADLLHAVAAKLEWKLNWTPTHDGLLAPFADGSVEFSMGNSVGINVPTVFTTIEDDGSFYIPSKFLNDSPGIDKIFRFAFFAEPTAKKLESLYTLSKYQESSRAAMSHLLTDMIFRCPAEKFAGWMAKNGNDNVWVALHDKKYSFTTYLPKPLPGIEHLGALHGSDHHLLFAPKVSDARIPKDLDLIDESRELRYRVVDFIRTGRADGWARQISKLEPSEQCTFWDTLPFMPINEQLARLRLPPIPVQETPTGEAKKDLDESTSKGTKTNELSRSANI